MVGFDQFAFQGPAGLCPFDSGKLVLLVSGSGVPLANPSHVRSGNVTDPLFFRGDSGLWYSPILAAEIFVLSKPPKRKNVCKSVCFPVFPKLSRTISFRKKEIKPKESGEFNPKKKWTTKKNLVFLLECWYPLVFVLVGGWMLGQKRWILSSLVTSMIKDLGPKFSWILWLPGKPSVPFF